MTTYEEWRVTGTGTGTGTGWPDDLALIPREDAL